MHRHTEARAYQSVIFDSPPSCSSDHVCWGDATTERERHSRPWRGCTDLLNWARDYFSHIVKWIVAALKEPAYCSNHTWIILAQWHSKPSWFLFMWLLFSKFTQVRGFVISWNITLDHVLDECLLLLHWRARAEVYILFNSYEPLADTHPHWPKKITKWS